MKVVNKIMKAKLITKTNKSIMNKIDKLIELIIFESYSAEQILTLTEQHLPIEDMGETFKGNHHLHIDRKTGKLILSIWASGHVYDVMFDK